MARISIMTLSIVALLLQVSPVKAQRFDEEHLYVVIINGGRNKLTNHERYWNDCSFLYQTLRHVYRIPKRNITVMMSDGGNPEEDLLKADLRGFISSPVDLDGDGLQDVDYPATEQAINHVMVRLSRQLTTDDHLFVFIVDHGGSKDHESDSFIWLWDDFQLSDRHFGLLMSLFDIGSINILMGQCYAGGFIDNLMYDRMVITTACGGHEQSWTCPDRPYDEFVYHWTCAVNGADELGNPVDADSNGDGEVSMAEAFEYAKSHDRVNETPLFVSQPQDLGSRWSFSNPGSIPTDFMEQRADDNEPAEMWSLSGIRSQSRSTNGVYIMHQGKRTRKVIRK